MTDVKYYNSFRSFALRHYCSLITPSFRNFSLILFKVECFASFKLYNFTPGFPNPRILETPDNSNQFWLPWGKLTLDNSNLPKISKPLSTDVNYIHNFKQIGHLEYQEHFSNHRPEFLGCKEATSYYKFFQLNWVNAIYWLYTTCVLLCSIFVFGQVRFVCK